MSLAQTRLRIMIAMATGVMAVFVALLYPYGNDGWRLISFALCLCSFGIGLWAIFPQYRAAKPWLVVAFGIALPSYFICTTRQVTDELITARFHGTITKVYRSDNHQYPAVEVADASGETFAIEALPEKSWAAVRVGDNVQKEPLRTFFTRGNERLPVVGPSFLHALRGAKSG